PDSGRRWKRCAGRSLWLSSAAEDLHQDMGDPMKALSALTVTVLASLVGATDPGQTWGSPPSASGLKEDLQDVVEQEVWRAGGPRPDRMLDWFRRAEESGKPEAVEAVWDVLSPLFS